MLNLDSPLGNPLSKIIFSRQELFAKWLAILNVNTDVFFIKWANPGLFLFIFVFSTCHNLN